MFHLWLVFRFVASGKRLLSTTTILSLFGMMAGVASLTVAMGVVSGFENTMASAIIDVFGDIEVVRRGDKTAQDMSAVIARIKNIAPETKAFTPFVKLDGLIANQGKLAGVIIQGFEPTSVGNVLNMKSRVIRGAFSLGETQTAGGTFPQALVGKALAKRFGFQVGEVFKIVLPMPTKGDSSGFTPKIMTFVLAGVLDLGKDDYDERYVVTDLKTAQSFGEVGEAFSGLRIKVQDSKLAPEIASRLSRELGPQYFVMNWHEVNENLFEAVKIERVVIFFVILVMVIAAAFNICSNLFVSVLKKYSDISVLRALGFSQADVRRVFITQGLLFGAIGTVLGLVLGFLLSLGFVVIQKYIVVLPVETYHIDHVGVVFRPQDLALIVVASMLICLFSTLIPAWRGAKLDPVEGLRYE